MTIYLIRHGSTDANEQRLYCGKTDLPLSKAGRAALKPLTVPADCRFITSGLRRANETLTLLFGNVPYTTEADLMEMDFGAFELRSYAQLQQDPDYIAWLTGDNEANITPGGESGNQMRLRALGAFYAIVRENADTVIVTHGGVIAAIMQDLFPGSGKTRYQWQSPNGQGYRLTLQAGRWTYAPYPISQP